MVLKYFDPVYYIVKAWE